ncbi:MAG: MBL fold metallo-hydrolase [Spirochaetales bacterium]|nr:MBL fold metallo-hydrolase [Spirochaetales bacterium]
MKKIVFRFLICVLSLHIFVFCQNSTAEEREMDEFKIGDKILKIYFLGHATLMLDYDGIIIHVDPVAAYGDYDRLPQADIVLVTHQHGDHLDKATIDKISKSGTKLILNQAAYEMIKTGIVLENGKTWQADAIKIQAVPAYNTTPGRDKYHPKGRDNGYVLTLGQTRIYIAGDTENIPEMSDLKNIDIAFLPMNQPYTMTPEQVAAAVNVIKPKIVYPYHYGNTDVNQLKELLKNNNDVELRIRELQ